MKAILLLFVLILCFFNNASADDCGLSTVNVNNQESIISVQECIKKTLTELKGIVNTHGDLVEKFEKKAKAIISEESLCKKFEIYYKNAKNDYERKYLKENVSECYALLNGRTTQLAEFKESYYKMNSEAKKIKILVLALENKYNLLASQLVFLKD